MILALSLKEVSPTARIVGAALAYHGWSSWPSRDRLAGLLRLDKSNIRKAVRELEKSGAVRSFRRHRTSGNIQYVFGGQLLLLADAEIQEKITPCYDPTQGVKSTPWGGQIYPRTGKEPEGATGKPVRVRGSEPLLLPTGFFQDPGDTAL